MSKYLTYTDVVFKERRLLLAALAEIRLVAHVGHVGPHLSDVAERGAVLVEEALDLVEGVFALRCEIALVQNIARLAVLVLRADAREKDHFARAGDGYRVLERRGHVRPVFEV